MNGCRNWISRKVAEKREGRAKDQRGTNCPQNLREPLASFAPSRLDGRAAEGSLPSAACPPILMRTCVRKPEGTSDDRQSKIVNRKSQMVKPPPAYPVPAVRPVPPVVIAEKVVSGLQAKRTETHVRRIDERPARYGEWPDLDARLLAVLRKRGIEYPYVHQSKAMANAIAGKNTVVVTPTASGKTLCYNAPVLDAILKDTATRALYLFPTKALAQDQLDELHGLVTDLQ